MYSIHVGCLPFSASSILLRDYFSHYGSIDSVRIVKKKHDLNICTGNAVIECSDKETYEDILQIKVFIFHGRRIFCEPVLYGEALESKNRELSQRRIFLSNIPSWMDDSMLQQIMSRFGPVQTAYRIHTHPNPVSPYGFVTFYSLSSAQLAVRVRKVDVMDIDINQIVSLYITPFRKNNHRQNRQNASSIQETVHDDNIHIKTPTNKQYYLRLNQNPTETIDNIRFNRENRCKIGLSF